MHLEVRALRWVIRSGRLVTTALITLGASGAALPAQETIPAPQAAATLPAPATVAAAPAPLTLDACLHLAFAKQPALAAAQASLAGAQDGRQALDNLPLYARCLTRDLPIRKQQACLGVTIAQAALWQAEWETRYAVTRNYFSVIYARTQQGLLADVVARLEKGRNTTAKLLKAGDPEFRVTQIDLDLFDVNIDLLRVKGVEADVGIQKAFAALREAIGIGPDDPLEIAAGTLPAPLPALDRAALIQAALTNRAEVTQAASANRVTELEIAAQATKRHALKVGTFAGGADIHAQPIPQGVANGEYRPGAIGLEMPPMLVGKVDDRVARASDLHQRAGAVVDKTNNLVALETEAAYLKWVEARDKLTRLAAVRPRAAAAAKKIEQRLDQGKANGSEYIQATTLVDQIQAQYNEALYMHALALTALERITAGGFRVCTTFTQP